MKLKYVIVILLVISIFPIISSDTNVGKDLTYGRVIYRPPELNTSITQNITMGSDGNASSICTGGEVLLGNGTCMEVTHFLSTYNATYIGSVNNLSYLSTYNSTYANWAYNQTLAGDTLWILQNSSSYYFNESGLSTIYYNATQSLNVTGLIDAGTLVETQHQNGDYDGNTFNFSEVATNPGIDLRINFTGVNDFNVGVMRYKTSALSGIYPIIQVWNYNDSVWEDYPAVAESLSFATIEQPVFDDSSHVGAGANAGVIQMRIYKSAIGNPNNHYYIDWIAIAKGYGTPSGEEVDPLSIHRDGDIELTANWTAGKFEVSAQWFRGLFNWTTIGEWFSFDGSHLSFNETHLNVSTDNRINYHGLINNLSYLSTYNATYSSFAQDVYVNETGDTMTGNLSLGAGVVISDDDSTSYIKFRNNKIIIVAGK